MTELTVAQIADLCASTLPSMEKGTWTDLAQDLQRYVALPNILRKDRIIFRGGKDVRFMVQTKIGSNARHPGLFDEDKTNIEDGLHEATMQWTNTVNSWGFDAHEVDVNGDVAAQIVELMDVRRAQSYLGLAGLLEEDYWSCPAADDTTTPHGIPYWIVKSATTPTGGFTGNVPSGYSTVANLTPATNPNWRNWSYNYTSISKEDFVRRLRKAATYCKFISPVPQKLTDFGDIWGYYTNYAVLGLLEEELEAQNDNLGNDIASKDGEVLFRRRPITFAPYLDADTSNPIYGIDWGKFRTVFLTNWYLKDRAPKEKANAHNVLEGFTDLTHEWICFDRRSTFVGYVA